MVNCSLNSGFLLGDELPAGGVSDSVVPFGEISVNLSVKNLLISEPKTQRRSTSVPHAALYGTHCLCVAVRFLIKSIKSI